MKQVSQFKSLQKLHTAMLAGMVLFCVVSAVVKLPLKLADYPNLDKILQVTVLALGFALIKTGLSVFDRKLQSIPAGASAQEKINVYRTAALIKWVLIEIPVLLCVIAFMLTHNYAFIALAFAIIIYFALQGPVKLKVMIELRLSEKEADQLDGISN